MKKTLLKILFAAGLSLLLQAQSVKPDFDFLLINGLVYDGIHEEPSPADIGIRGDRVLALGDLKGHSAGRVLDLKGLIVQPGIIDAHTHSDFTPFSDPRFEHALRQGVTTVIVGNCGMSAFPVTGANEARERGIWEGEGVRMPAGYLAGDFSEYEKQAEAARPAVNLASLVGQGNLRNAVSPGLGLRADEKSVRRESEALGRNLEQGSLGLSLGLAYLPGILSGEKELLRLARRVRAADGVITVHLRSEGRELEESIEEAVRLARRSGARLVISHFKAAGSANWGKFFPALERLALARSQGVPVFITVYPYTAAQTELGALLPSWFYTAGDRSVLLGNEEARERLRKELQGRKFDPGGLVISVVQSEKNSRWEGKTIGDFARSRDLKDVDGMLELLREEDFRVSVFAFGQHPYLVREALKQSFAMAVSDTVAELSGHPHPRAYGAFPTYFHDLSLDSSALTLGEAIRRVTHLPAEVYGLRERGAIRVGDFADIMIWDQKSYNAKSTYQNPRVPAEGVRYLFINGRLVIDDYKMTAKRPGRVLRRTGSQKKVDG